MITTINISLPKKMYEDAKQALVTKRYTSISELIRDGLRKILYGEELTENGFTKEFEEQVLRAEAEPMENDTVFETEKDIINYFKYLKKPSKKRRIHDQNQKRRPI